MRQKIDLNCDLGESFGRYHLGSDEAVIPIISSCNIACGYHASDPCVMRKTVELAAQHGVAIGAHPGLPDLMGFGRRNMLIAPEEAADYVTYQVGALWGFVKANGLSLQHVKPHGALYNMAAKDYKLSLAIAKAIQKIDDTLILMGLAGSQTIRAAQDIGLSVAQEVFADRAYMDDGTLVPRSRKDAMIVSEKESVERVVRMIRDGKVASVDGNDISICPDSVCVHGDGERALKFVELLQSGLIEHGIEIVSLNSGKKKEAQN